MSLPRTRAAGFFGHLRHSEQSLRLVLDHPQKPISWPVLDAWLSRVFGMAEMASQRPVNDSPSAEIVALSWRIMAVSVMLQRAGNIPTFDLGQILSLHADAAQPQRWQINLSISHTDYVGARAIQLAYDSASQLVMGFVGSPQQFVDASAIYTQLETAVLPKLRAAIQVGKSALPVLCAAHALDMPWRHLGAGIFQLGWGSHSLRMKNSKIDSDSSLGATVVQNKWLAAEWLRRAGLPAPSHHLVASEAEALAAQQALGWPLVVKPADRDRGEGVVVNIRDRDALLSAFQQAQTLSSQILVERQAPGVCHRVLIVRGRVIYVVKRMPIAVCGDGQRSIAELIATINTTQERLPPWSREPLYPLDEPTRAFLKQSQLSFASVLPLGIWAALRPIESTAWGGLDEDFTDTIHPDNVDAACRAAGLFGLDMAGVDIISSDIRRPWHENAAIINEVNATPMLGQGESSRRTLPGLLAQLLPQPRIAVDAFVGGVQAYDLARARQREYAKAGVACYLSSHAQTLLPSGQPLHLLADGLFARSLALLGDRRVEALILVIQNDEVIVTGAPIDRLQKLVFSGEPIVSHQQPSEPASAEHTQQISGLLRLLCGTP